MLVEEGSESEASPTYYGEGSMRFKDAFDGDMGKKFIKTGSSKGPPPMLRNLDYSGLESGSKKSGEDGFHQVVL